MSIVIENSRVVSSGKIEARALYIRDGRFCAPFSTRRLKINASALCVTPGLVDLQINGFAGREFIDGMEAAVVNLPAHGVTSFLPTLPSSAIETYQVDTLKIPLQQARLLSGAVPLGWHLEGPFINQERSGAHLKKYILAQLDASIWEPLFKSKSIALVTFAPESPAASDLLDLLQKEGISAAIGHSSPGGQEIRVAVENGVRLVTHLFNAMPPLHHRKENLIASVLGNNQFSSTIIADLVHVSREALRIAYKCCSGRLALVSDAAPLVGSSETTGRFLEQRIERREVACYLEGTSTPVGSALCLDEQMRNAMEVLSIPFEEAIDLVTSIPAAYIGFQNSKGKIAEGYDADCVFWEEGTVVATIVKGRLVYYQDHFIKRIQE